MMKTGTTEKEFQDALVETLQARIVSLEKEKNTLVKRLQAVSNQLTRQIHLINSSLADQKNP